MNFLEGVEPGWLWLIGGVVLLIAEIIAPGFFLVFIGAAAIATGFMGSRGASGTALATGALPSAALACTI